MWGLVDKVCLSSLAASWDPSAGVEVPLTPLLQRGTASERQLLDSGSCVPPYAHTKPLMRLYSFMLFCKLAVSL